ncbi:hypothetical protein ABZ608_09435 [Streptomyces sp. NPDC013172]|uniref:GNAT family N-acetyltransferase n=1 Tax=Streptomyces sp. NPDC013172 TaxID=3155009 RepID=UPI0033D9FC9B
MADPRPLAWPPAPIKTERLVLRESQTRDRATVIELNAPPEVNAYLGGPRPRAELERTLPGVPGQRCGWFVVEFDGAMIGTANAGSMRLAAKLGFTEVERFEAWGAEQWFGVRPPPAPSD